MAPHSDYLVEVVFTLPGEVQLIRISGQQRTLVAKGLFCVLRYVPFPALPTAACLYAAEVNKTRVYFSETPGYCVQTSPKHYAFAEAGSWLGLSLPQEAGVEEIERLEKLLVEHAGLERKGSTGRPPGQPPPSERFHTVSDGGDGQVVRIAPGQLSLELVSAAAGPYVKELQKQVGW